MVGQNAKRLPDFITIGSQKGGTTSLHYYLSLHPEIYVSREKELDFFIEKRNWHKGVDWYSSNFDTDAKLCGEVSPNYTYYPKFKDVARKIHSIVPETKLIYVLRDPVQRSVSEYLHMYTIGRENKDINEALKNIESSPYISRSRYYMQLEQFLPYFPQSSFYFLTSEDLSRKTEETLQKLFRFLGADDCFSDRRFSKVKHKTEDRRRKNAMGVWLSNTSAIQSLDKLPYDVREKLKAAIFYPFSERVQRPTIAPGLQAELIDYFRPDVERLREFTNCSFNDWCV